MLTPQTHIAVYEKHLLIRLRKSHRQVRNNKTLTFVRPRTTKQHRIRILII